MTTETSTPQTEPTQIPKRSKIPNVTIINVVLLIGLLVLYALHFLPAKNGVQEPTNQNDSLNVIESLQSGAYKIAFVDSDTLMANYNLARKMRVDFESEQSRLDNDLKRKQTTFQADVESFQRQIQLGLITMENGQAKEQELMQRQQELLQLNDTYASQLMIKEAEMNRELYEKITGMLEKYNAEMQFDYILGFSPGGGILYANDKLDITNQILQLLNEEDTIQTP